MFRKSNSKIDKPTHSSEFLDNFNKKKEVVCSNLFFKNRQKVGKLKFSRL